MCSVREGGGVMCSVREGGRGSNVGELTPRGQEAVRCAQATLLTPSVPKVYGTWKQVYQKLYMVQGTWYMVHWNDVKNA